MIFTVSSPNARTKINFLGHHVEIRIKDAGTVELILLDFMVYYTKRHDKHWVEWMHFLDCKLLGQWRARKVRSW